jgi:uncharacterized membrane protein (UPF0127 family)
MTHRGRKSSPVVARGRPCNYPRLLRLALPAAVLLAAAVAAGATTASLPKATLAIASHSGTVRRSVEVARTPAQQERGLMLRRSLPQDAGMVFPFARPTSAGFWMKDTLIPLSVAFYDAGGRILRILDMTPCTRDPCRVYSPGVVYRGAVEANRGWFARAHGRVGDGVSLHRR